MNKQQELLSQKRAGSSNLTMNAFSRDVYATALRSLGEPVRASERKSDLFKRIMANPDAVAVVKSHSWHLHRVMSDEAPTVSDANTRLWATTSKGV